MNFKDFKYNENLQYIIIQNININIICLFLASSAYPRPNLLPSRDPTLGLHHPSDVLARPFVDQVRPFNKI